MNDQIDQHRRASPEERKHTQTSSGGGGRFRIQNRMDRAECSASRHSYDKGGWGGEGGVHLGKRKTPPFGQSFPCHSERIETEEELHLS